MQIRETAKDANQRRSQIAEEDIYQDTNQRRLLIVVEDTDQLWIAECGKDAESRKNRRHKSM